MKIPKPSDDDKQFFRCLVPEAPGVEIKPMFGNLGAFVNGNMFMGLFGPDIGLRLDGAGMAELAAVDGAGAFGPRERPMKDYVSIPRTWRSDPTRIDEWVARAHRHVAAMPPKVKQAKMKK